MVRGIERRTIFRVTADRADFVTRVAGLAEQGSLTVYAWALLPNHAHLWVRGSNAPNVAGFHQSISTDGE
jgi:REP element-mobilizing transposase RayT